MPDFKIAAAQIASIHGDSSKYRNPCGGDLSGGGVRRFGSRLPGVFADRLRTRSGGGPGHNGHRQPVIPLFKLARTHQIELVVEPSQTGESKPALGAILFHGSGELQTYRKMHLERASSLGFAPGNERDADLFRTRAGDCRLPDASNRRSQAYADLGCDIYAAGVFLKCRMVCDRRPPVGRLCVRHRTLTVMANHAASVGTLTSVGRVR